MTAAKRAFEAYSEVSVEQRLALLRRIIDVYKSKLEEMATTISQEMGLPSPFPEKLRLPPVSHT